MLYIFRIIQLSLEVSSWEKVEANVPVGVDLFPTTGSSSPRPRPCRRCTCATLRSSSSRCSVGEQKIMKSQLHF